MSGITTLCFAASYGVALALEVARLGWRSRLRGALAVGFAAAGLVAQTLFLCYRAATAEAAPLSSAYEWYLLAAWALAAVYLYMALSHPAAASGIFILPLALGLVAAAQFASKQPLAEKSAAGVWVDIHATCWLLGTVAVIVGFATGLMYLLQARRLKSLSKNRLGRGGQSPFPPDHRGGPRGCPARPEKGTVPAGSPLAGLRLPSLEWLERANGRAILISVLMAAAGLLSGVVLNLVRHKLPWSDATIWRSAGLFGWLLAAALFSGLYRPARRGRKVAYLTVASFVFLAIFLAAELFGRTEHAAAAAAGLGGRRSGVSKVGPGVGDQSSEAGRRIACCGTVSGRFHESRPQVSAFVLRETFGRASGMVGRPCHNPGLTSDLRLLTSDHCPLTPDPRPLTPVPEAPA